MAVHKFPTQHAHTFLHLQPFSKWMLEVRRMLEESLQRELSSEMRNILGGEKGYKRLKKKNFAVNIIRRNANLTVEQLGVWRFLLPLNVG